MKRTGRMVFILVLIGILAVPAVSFALDPLGDLLVSIDKQARSNLVTFTKDVSSTFGLPVPDVDKLLKVLPSPGDVYMALRVSQVAKVPVDRVVTEFKKSKGQGWGVVAKRLGIKPGSPEFHALKEGKLPTHSGAHASSGHGKSSHGRGGGSHGHGGHGRGKK